jgi:membrane protease YdiL (CAAX protease family)
MMDAAVLLGLIVAAVAWGLLFALGRDGFWPRAAAAGATIGVYALVVLRHDLGDLLRPEVPEVAIGAVAAAVLWAVFWIGDRLVARLFPALSAQVDDLYAVRGETTAARMPLVLAVIGPAEEVFWRGLVQSRAGIAVALVAYALVHVWERKPILLLAALVGGAFWGALFAWRGTLVAPIVSHLLWDLAIIVWFPTRDARRRPRGGASHA